MPCLLHRIIGDVHGIFCEAGYMELEGKFTVGARRWGINCRGTDITLNGDFTVYSDEYGVHADNGSIIAKPGKAMEELAANTAMYCYYAKNYFAN